MSVKKYITTLIILLAFIFIGVDLDKKILIAHPGWWVLYGAAFGIIFTLDIFLIKKNKGTDRPMKN